MPRLIAFASLVLRPWKNGGGITRQIACFPPDAGLDDFDWRLSTASVAQDGGFSHFPGVDRRLHILEGAGLDLDFVNGTQRLLPGGHIGFPGEADVHGRLIDGPVTDFNIMVRRGRVRMRAEQMTIDGATTIAHGWGTAALFVVRGKIAVSGDVAGRFDTVLAEGAGSLRVSGAADVLLIGFEDVT